MCALLEGRGPDWYEQKVRHSRFLIKMWRTETYLQDGLLQSHTAESKLSQASVKYVRPWRCGAVWVFQIKLRALSKGLRGGTLMYVQAGLVSYGDGPFSETTRNCYSLIWPSDGQMVSGNSSQSQMSSFWWGQVEGFALFSLFGVFPILNLVFLLV